MRIFSKNKRLEEKREIIVSLYLSSKNKGYLKRILYERRKERKEKYEMTHAVVYDLAYLIVLCELNTFFSTEEQMGER